MKRCYEINGEVKNGKETNSGHYFRADNTHNRRTRSILFGLLKQHICCLSSNHTRSTLLDRTYMEAT